MSRMLSNSFLFLNKGENYIEITKLLVYNFYYFEI